MLDGSEGSQSLRSVLGIAGVGLKRTPWPPTACATATRSSVGASTFETCATSKQGNVLTFPPAGWQ